MLKNYCKIAWRNLVQNRTFSLINLVGLSISVAFCLLLFFDIRWEQSYDQFHAKKDRLFRFEATKLFNSDKKPSKSLFSFLTKGDDGDYGLVQPLIVGRDLKQAFPEVTSVVRFQNDGDMLIRADKSIFKEKDVVYSDGSLFTSFSFPMIAGDPARALSSPDKVVLSAKSATKMFGSVQNAIGKTISLVSDSTRLFTVAGVAADAPTNSSIQFSVVVPLEADPDYTENIKSGFNHMSHLLVVELAPGVDQAAFEKKMAAWTKTYFVQPFVKEYGQYYKDVDFSKFSYRLRPLADSHYNVSAPWGHYTNARNIYQLACLAVVILMIAALNYVLLMISNASARSQEIGVRKVIGAGRWSIVLQFYVETQVLVLVAVMVGFGLCLLLLPVFNHMMGVSIEIGGLSLLSMLGGLLGLCLLLGLIAGYYPAMLLSGIRPLSIVKSFATFKINPRFSRVMVVVQFTACVVLMLSAFIINRQMSLITHMDLGFDKEQVLMVDNPTWDGDWTARVRDRLRAFAATQPNIIAVSGMNGGLDGSYNNNGFMLNGEHLWRKNLTVDYDYFEMLGLKFVQGRGFSRDFATDTSSKFRPIVVNETLWKLLGATARLGEFNEPLHGTIIGVVKDYHFETLTKRIEPEDHVLAKRYESKFMFKIRGGHIPETIEALHSAWKGIAGDYPFEYTFLDASIAKMYEADRRWQAMIQSACGFAIFIACLGLFGLSAVNAMNRTREIGIRKVLGAEVRDIFRTLSAPFVAMVGVSVIIAAPVAWWVMSRYLEDFAYRVEMRWWMFVLVGIVAMGVALMTVAWQVWRAAVANPVESLRAE